MKSQNYKQAILNAYKEQDLTPEDFADTLDYFEKLVREEAEPKPIELIEGETYVYTGEDIQSLNTKGVFLKRNSIVVFVEIYNVSVSVKDKEGLRWLVNNSDLAPLPKGPRTTHKKMMENNLKAHEEKQREIFEKKYDHLAPLPKEINPDDFTPEQQQDVIQALNDTPRPLNMNGVNESIEFDASQFVERTPLGITPRFVLKDRRIIEIAQAIIRYSGVNKTIPSEWITELKELTC